MFSSTCSSRLFQVFLCASAILSNSPGHVQASKQTVPIGGPPDKSLYWMPLAHYDPRNVEPVGRANADGSEPIFLVRIKTEDGSKIPGMTSPKLWLDTVHYGYKGNETLISSPQYESRDTQFLWWPPGTLSWVYGNKGNVIKKLKLSTGNTKARGGSVPAYVCRSFVEEGTRKLVIGVWSEGQEGCLIPWNGKEILKPHFEVLVINELGVLMNIMGTTRKV